jgi:hypothetical protein
MKIRGDYKRNLAIVFLVLVVLSPILVNRVAAAGGGLSLPSVPVVIEVINGTLSYFNTTLSGVSSGYDVTNATYPGWCVDRTAEMTRSPATHDVLLYSSLNPPGTLASQKWDMVNYILNHKQGTAQDIQQAIWYFIDMIGNFTSISTLAQAMVNDALANGTGFGPTKGQSMAVICFPVTLSPPATSVQISIIEVTRPRSLIGDITGPTGWPDGVVDMQDVGFIARHFGQKVPPAPASCDLNGPTKGVPDGLVDMRDIGVVARNVGTHDP